MRPILIGLLAAIVAATLPATALADAKAPKGPEITSDQKAQGMKETPKLIAAAGLPCQLAAARFIGEAADPATKKMNKYYEVACKGAIGFVVVDKGGKDAPVWYTCAEAPRVDKLTGKPNPGACYLPGNTDDVAMITPFVTKSGVQCDVTKVRGIGHSPEQADFEVLCGNGHGFVLATSSPPDPAKDVKAESCLRFPPTSQLACTLSSYDDQMKVVDTYVAQMGKPCTIKDRRYVGEDEKDHASFFEVSCQDGKGYMVEADASGKVTPIDCAVADNIGGGCTLTNARAAETEQAGLYSKLAQKAGYNCDVEKYFPFNTSPPGDEAVELKCHGRADGAVGIFPVTSHDAAQIFDCGHSQVVGYRCGFSDADASLPGLTADLNKLGKTTCVVSAQRFIAKTVDNHGYIEVACADGGRGYIIEYTSQPLAPDQAIPCVSAKDIEGGCTLPGNKG